MSRSQQFGQKWAILGGLASLAFLGCSPSTLGFLFAERERPPVQPLEHREDKKEIAVLVMVSSSPTIGMDYQGSDRVVAPHAGPQLEDGSKKSKHPFKVIDPLKLDKLRNSPGFDARNPASVGKQLGADYVLDVNVTSMKMLPAQFGGEFLEGEATVAVTVYDVTKPDTIYRQYELNPKTPMKGTASVTTTIYRRMLIQRIANEVAWQHIPHEPDNGISASK